MRAQDVPHRVFSLRGLQPPAYPRVEFAAPRTGSSAAPTTTWWRGPGRRRPAQLAPGAAAANGGYSWKRRGGPPPEEAGARRGPRRAAILGPTRRPLQLPVRRSVLGAVCTVLPSFAARSHALSVSLDSPGTPTLHVCVSV